MKEKPIFWVAVMACSLWLFQIESIHKKVQKIPISGLIDLPFPDNVFEFGIVWCWYDPVNDDNKL